MQRISMISAAGLVFLAGCHSSGASQANAAATANIAASTTDGATAADIDAVQSFTLTDAYLVKYEAYQEEAAKDPCGLSPMTLLGKDDDKAPTLDQTVADFSAQPGVPAALQRAGLSARDLIVGTATLMSAAVQDLAAKHPDMVEKGEINTQVPVSAANMAFYHEHQQALHEHQMKLGKELLAKNGGKLPPCLSDGG